MAGEGNSSSRLSEGSLERDPFMAGSMPGRKASPRPLRPGYGLPGLTAHSACGREFSARGPTDRHHFEQAVRNSATRDFLMVSFSNAWGPLTKSRTLARSGCVSVCVDQTPAQGAHWRSPREWRKRAEDLRRLENSFAYCTGTSTSFSSQCSVVSSQRFLSPASKSALSGKTVFITWARSFSTSTSASRSR
jgi:hypothetical protein